ncbi:DUF2798 domain-containing protein [Polynucleobacter sp. 86C-FISCH]|uniref:DUF2798 domain-containing protein n=1 Tax=Polynucleobacter sp. 86C-FISCH TaxID=2689101 RepID=UPI001C0BABC2|nr:DUF2798 domain-containing protein [Polynucleobacter sp. 86C-FISCH]MBU3596717.1 DUF2798 domain-containing protein [Polynucleobacter sp. 86C-FISCH]
MKLSKKYLPFFSAALMSCIMSAAMSAVSLLTISGFNSNFFKEWLDSFAHVWPTSFIIIFIVAPFVRWVTSKVTEH